MSDDASPGGGEAPNFKYILPNCTKTALAEEEGGGGRFSIRQEPWDACGLCNVALTVHLDGRVKILDGVLSPEECLHLQVAVDDCAHLSFWSPAGRENDEARAFRDADTIEISNNSMARLLWERTSHLLTMPECIIHIPDEEPAEASRWEWERELPGEWLPAAYNHDVLFAKYPSEGGFAPHTDGRVIYDFNLRSFESVIVFLNDIPDGCGGGTRFYRNEAQKQLKRDTCGRWTADSSLVTLEVAPRAGRVLIFDQSLMHEGVPPALPHSKYIMRSDIMYQRCPAVCNGEKDREAYALYQQAENLAEQNQIDLSLALFSKAWKLSPTLARIQGQR